MLPRAAPAQLETKIERFVINKLLKNTDRVDNEIFPIDKVIPSYFRHLRTNKLTPSKARRPRASDTTHLTPVSPRALVLRPTRPDGALQAEGAAG